MPKREGKKKDNTDVVILGKTTSFTGVLKFSTTVRIRGTFKGTIEAEGDLIVDRDATVETDHITVSSLTVYGSVSGTVYAQNKVDMMNGAKVRGDVTAARLRIADGVLFEGQCRMTGVDKEVEIFSRPTDEIKTDLLKANGRI
ncbi:MAG: polymer-forming cytoskeletal protein [Treponema sp.]|jgi:cytoskeletal protein CcmA (bactofilin family)|nr:polymer-forming cytoskeletal protein [Treponema sp.]